MVLLSDVLNVFFRKVSGSVGGEISCLLDCDKPFVEDKVLLETRHLIRCVSLDGKAKPSHLV